MSANVMFQGVEKKVRLNQKVNDILEQLRIRSNLNYVSFSMNNLELQIEIKTQTLQKFNVVDGNTIFISIKVEQKFYQWQQQLYLQQQLEQQLTQLQQNQQPQYSKTEVAEVYQSDSYQERDKKPVQQERNYQQAYSLFKIKQSN